MDIRILIKGGTAVDGSGAAPFKADVLVAGGRTYHCTRDAAPMRLTLVNGEPTFDRGEFTGRYRGPFVGPETADALAIAAE